MYRNIPAQIESAYRLLIVEDPIQIPMYNPINAVNAEMKLINAALRIVTP